MRIWIYEDVHVQMEGVIIGFDEYMNIVLDDAIEINTNAKQQQQKRINVGRCLLKGDAITLIQLRIYVQNEFALLCSYPSYQKLSYI